jgi:hypothetical protein
MLPSSAAMRAGLGVDHQPAFVLAVRPVAAGARLLVVGVDLDRKLVAGEDVLDEKARQLGRRFEPDLADALAWRRGERRGQRVAAPGLLHLAGREPGHWFSAPPSLPTC